MATEEATPIHPVFQPRPGTDGLTARYLLWRLAEKTVIAANGCWEWTGARSARGYGTLEIKNPDWPESSVLLHRIAYQVCVEFIPDGLCVLHRCDNPPCIRPDHLFLGTNGDNIADKVQKGRQAAGQSVRRNHAHLKGEVIVTARMTAELVMLIRRRARNGESYAAIARDIGFSATQVSAAARGKSWSHLPMLT